MANENKNVNNELIKNGFFLPILSAICPESIEPVRYPTNTKLAYNEFNSSDIFHSFFNIGTIKVNIVI